MMNREELVTKAVRHGYHQVIRRAMFRSFGGDPERIHEAIIAVLSKFPSSPTPNGERCQVAGIDFPSRVGVAAGLDKDGKAAQAWGWFGFGFAELGTVTALAQPGNPTPRLFRLRASDAIINRMGFNNLGAEALAERLGSRGFFRGRAPIRIGISIGKSKVVDLKDARSDYLASFAAVERCADYVAINVSSPNTPGLRDLQAGDQIAVLVKSLVKEAIALSPGNPVPIFVKLAPDLESTQAREIAGIVEDCGASGLIATNTTLSRHGLVGPDRALAGEAGGLSGRPLTEVSRRFVAELREHTTLPIIGAGGIMCPNDAFAMFDVGADLVQVFTGFIFEGPALVHGINHLR